MQWKIFTTTATGCLAPMWRQTEFPSHSCVCVPVSASARANLNVFAVLVCLFIAEYSPKRETPISFVFAVSAWVLWHVCMHVHVWAGPWQSWVRSRLQTLTDWFWIQIRLGFVGSLGAAEDTLGKSCWMEMLQEKGTGSLRGRLLGSRETGHTCKSGTLWYLALQLELLCQTVRVQRWKYEQQ